MILVNRLIPWLVSLVLLGLFELSISDHTTIAWTIPISLVLLMVSIWHLTGQQLTKARFWHFLITPFFLLVSGWLFLVFLESSWQRHAFILALVVLEWLNLKVIFLYFFLRPRYQAHALENIASYVNILSIFLLSSRLYTLVISLGAPLEPMIVTAAIIVGLLTYQLFWASNIPLYRSWLYVVVISLVSAELFWAVDFLPTSVYIDGSIIAIGYYLMSGMARNFFADIIETRVMRRYLLIGATCLILIIVTAQWTT